jgi:mannosyltransferase OCH1-like enzyme
MEFRLWSHAEQDAFVANEFSDHPIAEVYFGAQFGPMAADIWRYLVLIRHGGWYFDINKCVRGGLARYASPECNIVVSYEQNAFELEHAAPDGLTHPNNVISNWGFGTAPNNPILTRVVEDICNDAPLYRNRLWKNPKEAIIDFTGPRRLTRTIHEHVSQFGAVGICQAGIDFNGCGVFDMPGSHVRYLTTPSYATAQNMPILL